LRKEDRLAWGTRNEFRKNGNNMNLAVINPINPKTLHQWTATINTMKQRHG